MKNTDSNYFLSINEIEDKLGKLDEILGQEIIYSKSETGNILDILEIANQVFISSINQKNDQLITKISYKYMIFRNYNPDIYNENIKLLKRYLDENIKQNNLNLAHSIYKAIHILNLMEGHVDKNIEEYKKYKEQLKLDEDDTGIKIREVKIPKGILKKEE